MELKFQEVPLSYLRLTEADPVYQEQTLEVIVPDSMPDVDRIVDCFGTVTVRSKENAAGSVTVTGGIQAGVLYIPEGERCPQRIEAFLPFTVKKELNCPDAEVCYDGWLKSIDARLLNTRKVLIRANLGSLFSSYCPEKTELAQPQEPPADLQLLHNSYAMCLPVCFAEKDFTLNEELELPESYPPVEKLLKSAYAVQIEESRMVGNKAVFKGIVRVHILYCTSQQEVRSWDGQVPFSQYAELDCEPEEAQIEVCPLIISAELDTDGQLDSTRLLLSLTLLMQLCISASLPVELTEDAYAARGSLEPQWQTCTLRPRLDAQELKQTGELTLSAQADEVVEAGVYADMPTVRRDGESLWVSAPVNVNVLYYDSEKQLHSKSGRGEVSCTTQLAREGGCRSRVCCTQTPTADVQKDTLMLHCPMEFRLETYADGKWQNLCGGKLTEPERKENRPSVVLRRAGRESLWSIAKQNRTTVGAIRAANALDKDEPTEGSLLLIPLR